MAQEASDLVLLVLLVLLLAQEVDQVDVAQQHLVLHVVLKKAQSVASSGPYQSEVGTGRLLAAEGSECESDFDDLVSEASCAALDDLVSYHSCGALDLLSVLGVQSGGRHGHGCLHDCLHDLDLKHVQDLESLGAAPIYY